MRTLVAVAVLALGTTVHTFAGQPGPAAQSIQLPCTQTTTIQCQPVTQTQNLNVPIPVPTPSPCDTCTPAPQLPIPTPGNACNNCGHDYGEGAFNDVDVYRTRTVMRDGFFRDDDDDGRGLFGRLFGRFRERRRAR